MVYGTGMSPHGDAAASVSEAVAASVRSAADTALWTEAGAAAENIAARQQIGGGPGPAAAGTQAGLSAGGNASATAGIAAQRMGKAPRAPLQRRHLAAAGVQSSAVGDGSWPEGPIKAPTQRLQDEAA